MTFLVTITNPGGEYFLRGTVWTGAIERAQQFPTREAAEAGLAKARKFVKPAMFKLARVREVLAVELPGGCGAARFDAATLLQDLEIKAASAAIIGRKLIASVSHGALTVTLTKPRYGFVDGVCIYSLDNVPCSKADAIAALERPGGCGAARFEVHHDVHGWYVVAPSEERDEGGFGPDGVSLGFDGRAHYETEAEAWAAVIALLDLERPGGCGAMRFRKFFSIDDAKAVKAQKETRDWLNAINYMAPAETAGVGNLCPHASTGCKALCLGTESGQAAMRREGEDNSVTRSRKAKAVYYMRERRAFMAECALHIHKALVRAEREGRRLCVRLNGSTDVAWESASVGGERLMSLFPTVQFVDYTKSVRRMMRSLKDATWPDNYHLTFSRSEDNEAECEAVLRAGGNVAVVFGDGVPVGSLMWDAPVVDGDKHDLRHLDAMGVVVGLTPKGRKAKRDASGFVLRNAVA